MQSVFLTDVTLRDGLQMESKAISTEQKHALLEALIQCGFDRIELTSFVHPKWVPQLADSQALCDRLFKSSLASQCEWMAFVPNEKGLERLFTYPIPWAGAFISTSATFNQKNVNRTIAENLAQLKAMTSAAKAEQRKMRIYVSTLFGCPYEGPIALESAEALLREVAALEPDEIALSDTIGVAMPAQVRALLERFLSFYPAEKTALHFHNTYGLALACCETAYAMGVRRFDGALGGLGGCPYAKGASGNVAIESIAYYFTRTGQREGAFPVKAIQSGLDLIRQRLGLPVRSPLASILEKGGELYGI